MALLALLYETSMGGEAGPLGTARPFQGAWANGPLSVGLAGGSIFKHGICHVVFVIALFIQLTIYVADVVRFEHVSGSKPSSSSVFFAQFRTALR